MKKSLNFSLLAVAVVAALAAGYYAGKQQSGHAQPEPQAGQENGRKVLYWYDPMVPGQRLINRVNHRLWIWSWWPAMRMR